MGNTVQIKRICLNCPNYITNNPDDRRLSIENCQLCVEEFYVDDKFCSESCMIQYSSGIYS